MLGAVFALIIRRPWSPRIRASNPDTANTPAATRQTSPNNAAMESTKPPSAHGYRVKPGFARPSMRFTTT